MEIKKTLLTLSLAAILSPAVVQAEQPNYSYFDAGYVRMDFDDLGIDPYGFFAKGSVSLNDNWFLQGGFYRAEDELVGFDVEATHFNFGGGFRTALSDSTSLHVTADYIREEAEVMDRYYHFYYGWQQDSVKVEEDGYGLSVGVRSMVSSRVELNADFNYADLGEFDGSDVGVGAVFYVTDNFGLLLEANFDEDSNRIYMLGGRISF